jgi:hypothetical protein
MITRVWYKVWYRLSFNIYYFIVVHTATKNLCKAARSCMIRARLKLLLSHWLNSLVVVVLKLYSVIIKQFIILILVFKKELKWENCLGKMWIVYCVALWTIKGMFIYVCYTHIHILHHFTYKQLSHSSIH